MMVEHTMQEFVRNRESKMLIAPYPWEPNPYEGHIQELSLGDSPRLAELPLDQQDVGAAGRLHWSSPLGGYAERRT